MTPFFNKSSGSARSILVVVFLKLSWSLELNASPPPASTIVGYLESQAIKESSGLAASRQSDDVLWTLNDSGDGNFLYAMTPQGKDLGTFEVKGATNVDWEDLASFTYQGNSYLAIADIGDNAAQRSHGMIYIVREPDLKKNEHSTNAMLNCAWKIPFVYEDGPRDAECIAVDTRLGKVFLLTKYDEPARLYEMPLRPTKGEHVVASKMAELDLRQPSLAGLPGDLLGTLLAKMQMATAMDLSPDGTKLAVLTYTKLFIFDLKNRKSLEEALTHRPVAIDLPKAKQYEAMAFNRDGSAIFATSEKQPTPLVRVDLQSLAEDRGKLDQ